MPTKPVKRFTSWSYSRLQDWDGCHLKAKLKHLDKVQEPGNAAMARGSSIHKEAEDYATGQLKRLPESLQNFKEEFQLLRKHRRSLMVEQDWALTVKWQPTTWFDSDAKPGELPWVRCRVDTALPQPLKKTVRLIDYKTGKMRDSHLDQLELYALVGFALMPEVQEASSELWYLDQGELTPKTFTRAQEPELRKRWEKKVAPMLLDTKFEAMPGAGCTWCYYGQAGKRKGGPGLCKY